MKEKVAQATKRLIESYYDQALPIHHLDRQPLPAHAEVVRIVASLQELMFPGYSGAQGLHDERLVQHVEAGMAALFETLTEQIKRAFSHGAKLDEPCGVRDVEAAEIAASFLDTLPEVRALLATDVDAAYEGDPAASCKDEVIFSYPSVYAVMVYRLAHELHQLSVPLIPRIMTELAHQRTGIDIHPGTQLGSHFFVDHGTGVVIGGTAVIGNRVKIYQGVTIGAFSFDKDANGNLIRNTKRHPTIEDEVVVYAGATILGGDTVIGKGSVIGGNVWLTHSVPAGTRVVQDSPHLKIITPDKLVAS